MNTVIEKPYVVITGKRWFDKQNGNTYHTVEVSLDGKNIGKSAVTYGYGTQFIRTAFLLLQEKGYYESGPLVDGGLDRYYLSFLDEIRHEAHRFKTFIFDVKSKYDL